MFSEQINFDNDRSITVVDTLKSYYHAELSCTPYGLTGSMTSSGSSFIPATANLKDCIYHPNYMNPSWDTILAMGNQKPEELKYRFELEGLKILELQLDTMDICMNVMQMSSFTQLVHFPYPSNVNIQFRDASYDGRKFHSSAGPTPVYTEIFPESDPENENHLIDTTNRVVYSYEQIRPKQKILKATPQSLILWFWRLPVTFVHNSIKINFEKLAYDRTDAISVRMDLSDPDDEGNFFNSELWIPHLYSQNSGVKCGVRFNANMTPDGGFSLLKFDNKPFFGISSYKQFNANLTSLTLADMNSRPASRNTDFNWDGSLEFPYFSSQNPNTWINVAFNIKNFIGSLEDGIGIPEISYKPKTCCKDYEEHECTSSMPSPEELSITIDELSYDPDLNCFLSNEFKAVSKIDGSEKDISNGQVKINSFTDAYIVLYDTEVIDTLISETLPQHGCGSHIKEELKNARSNTNIKDLICFDPRAMQLRIDSIGLGACCKDFFLGDYIISEDGVPVFIAENVKFFFDNHSLDLNGSRIIMDSQNSDEGMSLNIPGARLTIDSDGVIHGSFGATLASAAESLPYEGEFRFMLDTKCGYFYFLGAGSFTYGFRFSGLIFLIHAPYKYLSEYEAGLLESDIMESMRIRTLFIDINEFKEALQLNTIDSGETIITGILTGGNISRSFDLEVMKLHVGIGGGIYFFHLDDGVSAPSLHAGAFVNADGRADLLILAVKAYVGLYAAIETSTQIPLSDFLSDSNFILSGLMQVECCIGIGIGHCSGTARVKAKYSSDDGFDFSGVNVDAGCDWGGCD